MYTEHQPCELLSPYIDKYWVFKGNPDLGMRFKILPDGCCDFIFSIGDTADPTDKSQPVMQPYRSFFVGPMTTFSELVTQTPSIHMLGVRFRPCGLAFFCKSPLSEFTNHRISCNDLPLLFSDSFAEALCENQTLEKQIRLIENYLIGRLKNGYEIDRQIPLAIHYIDHSKGRLPIRRLMEEICICQRHFERKFKAYTGYTPKAYSRIMKFRNTIDLLKDCPPDNLLTIALEAGYYDLSHFNKEIRQLSGSTPASFLSITIPDDVSLTYIE